MGIIEKVKKRKVKKEKISINLNKTIYDELVQICSENDVKIDDIIDEMMINTLRAEKTRMKKEAKQQGYYNG